ncbi:unnamed protein product, partial [Closterium sp. NIES-65]
MVQRRGGGGKDGATGMAEEAHVPLQAILLADSFAQTFRPITLRKPKVGAHGYLDATLRLARGAMVDYIPLGSNSQSPVAMPHNAAPSPPHTLTPHFLLHAGAATRVWRAH